MPPLVTGGSTGVPAIDSEWGVGDFKALFSAQLLPMMRLAHLLGGDDPEDIAQEALARLHTRWDTLNHTDGQVTAYLRTTVVNLVRSRHRHHVVVARQRPLTAAVEPSSEDAAVHRADLDALLAGVSALPARQREAVVLRYWLDLPVAGVAAAMGLPVGTAKSHLSRANASLRAALAAGFEGNAHD
jgi:RNA polymerase sigma factor (sigma-70 family)